MDKMRIAYAPDENYVGLTVVSMVSALKNAGSDDIEFIILHSGLSHRAIEKLEWVKSYKNCSIRYVEVDRKIFAEYPLVCWVTTATWFRTKISDLCPEADRVLYLDSDTMIRSSIKELFELELSDNYVATVNVKNMRKDLNLKDNSYFNSGVILFNCKLWREENVFKKIDNFVKIHNKKISCADQDVLNVISDTRKLDLAQEYNYCEPHIRKEIDFTPKINPKIVHFTGPNPNKFTCINSFKPEWVELSMQTPCYDEFVNQNIYNIATSYKKLQRNKTRYLILSKITFGKVREEYIKKFNTINFILNSLKY